MDARADPTLTFALAWERWFAYRQASPRPLRLSTLADYRSAYRRHLAPRLCDTPLADIAGPTVADLVIALGGEDISPKRLSNVLVPLRACLKWHHRMGTLAADPTPWFDVAAPAADERRILSIAQVERLIAATPLPYRAFVATAAWTGLRMGELRALTWDDIDVGAGLITVNKSRYRQHVQTGTKNGQDRVVPIPSHLADELAAWRAVAPRRSDGLAFTGVRGTPIDADDFRRRVFAPALAHAGIDPDVRFHDLRHTSASLYLAAGATVREVMEIHGWKRMETAMRYLHTTEPLTRAAERLSEARAAALDADQGRPNREVP